MVCAKKEVHRSYHVLRSVVVYPDQPLRASHKALGVQSYIRTWRDRTYKNASTTHVDYLKTMSHIFRPTRCLEDDVS